MTLRRANTNLIWSLADFRRWRRALKVIRTRDLTNFGDLV